MAGAVAAASFVLEALGTFERLVADYPGNAKWQHGLLASLGRIGEVQRTQDDLPAALESFRAALAISEALVKDDAGNAEWQRDRAVSLTSMALS